MSGNFEPFAGPTYITSRSADVILSDVRPIKLKLEALRSMNVLLDEFLYNVLNAANSLSTDKLKTGLHKVLPSNLGNDSILEAELELKAYWERNTPHAPANQDFDLQWSFELLRLKCEAYSTMNDTDEDPEVEKRLNERMINAGGTAPPHTSLMAPAALYLTAILEHVCQHILSNVSRVAARDSSRTLATVNDLFIALCEDPSIYPTFKTMKVYQQIESLSKAPRRHKSMSKSSNKSIDRSRAASPNIDVTIRDIVSPQRTRVSSESVSNAAAAVLASLGSSRTSQDKSRMKLFGGRSSGDQDRSETPRSFDEEGRGGSFELMDEEAQREFDELMRSSTTMKVSLTPDRLKSMEVYKQEKRRRAPGQESENDPVIAISGGGEVRRAVSARRAQARLVDAITEDDEPSPIKAHPSSPSQPANTVPRVRQKSLTAAATPASSPSEAPPLPRSRSATVSNPQVQKKRSIGQIRPGIPQVPSTILIPSRENSVTSAPSAPPMQNGMKNGRPPRTRKMGRHRESMDLDEIMAGDDDELGALSPPPRTPRTPSSKRDPSKPYISKSARDLIDFLEEGPPEELSPPPIINANPSMISLESSRSKSGRLQRMMSKLSLGGSSEKLNGSSDSRRSPSMNGNAPSSYSQSSISSRNGRQMPNVVVATPPPPPSSFSPPPVASYPSPPAQYTSPASATTSPTFSPNGSISSAFPHQELAPSLGRSTPTEFNVPEKVRPQGRRTSIIRKAVPSLEPPTDRAQDRRDSPSPSPSSNVQTITVPPVEKSRAKSSSPLDEFPPVPTAVNIPPQARQRNDTMSGKSDMSIGAVIWAESSSTKSPLGSPVGTASPSPSSSLRRPSKQTSLRSVGSPSTPTSHVNGVNGVHHHHQLRQASPSPEPAPSSELQSEVEEVVQIQTHSVEPSVTTAVSAVPQTEIVGDEEPKLVTAVRSPPAFTVDDAQGLRKLLSSASSADECRLLVDMFLVRSGYPVLTGPFEETVASEAELSKAGEDLSKKAAENAEMERSLIMHYLGGFDDVSDESPVVSA